MPDERGIVSKSKLTALASAIKTKAGASGTYTLDELVEIADDIGGDGGTDLTPFFAVAGEVTPTEDSTSMAFPVNDKLSTVNNVLFFLAYVDDYTQFFSQNNMIVGCYKANLQFKVPSGVAAAKTIQAINTSKNPPIDFWTSATSESISGSNYVISNSRNSYFKSGVKYTYILVGIENDS